MSPPISGIVCAPHSLAQSGLAAAALWIAVLLAVVVGASIVLLVVRRRLLGEQSEDAGLGITLEDLRRMHARGELTDDEFAAAKRVVIGEAGGEADAAGPGTNPVTGARRARPGFDLTGTPLPRPESERNMGEV